MTALAQKHRVFVVDDHPILREALSTLIAHEDDFEICGESDDAVRALDEIGAANPALAVVDISLKDGSGLELIKNLRAVHPSVAVLVLSMHDEALYAERALRAGARGYVMKRDTTRKLLEAMRRVMEGGVYLSERFAADLAARLVHQPHGTGKTPVESLSDRELEVFRLLGKGRGAPAVAVSMHLSRKTVNAYCARIKAKLGLGNMAELLREAVRFVADAER